MSTDLETSALPSDPGQLQALVAELMERVSRLERENRALEMRARELFRKLYGRKSEKLQPDQLELVFEAMIDRLLRASDLPHDKTLATLKLARLPAPVRRRLPGLCEGGFVERAENLLAFGLPGRGKSHVVAAIGHELVQRGYQVLFVPAFKLVQRLLAAKRDLALETTLRRLDRFDAVILDDLGYVQQSREEMEVLFTFLAERYERRSVLITSNLVFSQWDRIFHDPTTTAAAIDRLVHHAVILEMSGKSVRAEEAQLRAAEPQEGP
jgi:DNA replication protein DnaC